MSLPRTPQSGAVAPSRVSEGIARAIEWMRTAVHYGWLPFVLAVGYLRCEQRPPLIRLLNPLS